MNKILLPASTPLGRVTLKVREVKIMHIDKSNCFFFKKFVAFLLCLSILISSSWGIESSAEQDLHQFDFYVQCDSIQHETLLPVYVILNEIGMKLETNLLETENLLEWRGNRYILTLVNWNDDFDLKKVPYQIQPGPLQDGRYVSSIFPENSYRNNDPNSLSLDSFDVVEYCSVINPGNSELIFVPPFFTDASIIDNTLYYSPLTLSQLLENFGLHGEWIPSKSLYHVWSYTSEDYQASVWAIPELMFSVENGLLLADSYSYSTEASRLFFWRLVKDTYRHIYAIELPESYSKLIVPDSEEYIARENALYALAQIFFPLSKYAERPEPPVFSDEEAFSTSEFLESARYLHMYGILQGVNTEKESACCALPQSMLTYEQAVVLVARIYRHSNTDNSL